MKNLNPAMSWLSSALSSFTFIPFAQSEQVTTVLASNACQAFETFILALESKLQARATNLMKLLIALHYRASIRTSKPRCLDQ
jgi:hypothetical protein